MNDNSDKRLSIRRSLFFSFAQRYAGLVLGLPTIMIISRLLTPSEIGVFSVAVVLVNLVHMLRDFGVSDFLVQTQRLDDDVARTAFTITLLLGWSLGFIVYGISGPVGAFYDKSGLASVIAIMSLNFFLLPFGSVTNARLQRDMRFDARFVIKFTRQVVQSALTIALAFLGFSYYSLAWGAVGATAAEVLACSFWRRDYAVYGLGLTGWREVGNFGLQRTFGDIMARLGQAAPDFVIGRIIDFAAVGFYSRGRGLIRMFRQNVLNAIGAVTFPVYSRDFRNADQPHLLFEKALAYSTGIAWPFLGFAAIGAFPIIRIMFGDQWDAAIPILQILAIGSLVGITSADCGQFLTAIGRIGTVTSIITAIQALRIAVLLSTAFHGLQAVAIGQIACGLVSTILYYTAMLHYSDMRLMGLLRAVWPSFGLAIITLAPAGATRWLLPPGPGMVWEPIIAYSLAAATGGIIGLCVTRHPLRSELLHLMSMAANRLRALAS